MEAFELNTLVANQQQSGRAYHQFLERPTLRCGLYRLAVGSHDPQQPHREDELYYVLAGQAEIEVAGERRPVGPGSLVYVAAGVEHRFQAIAIDLLVLVIFGARPPA